MTSKTTDNLLYLPAKYIKDVVTFGTADLPALGDVVEAGAAYRAPGHGLWQGTSKEAAKQVAEAEKRVFKAAEPLKWVPSADPLFLGTFGAQVSLGDRSIDDRFNMGIR